MSNIILKELSFSVKILNILGKLPHGLIMNVGKSWSWKMAVGDNCIL